NGHNLEIFALNFTVTNLLFAEDMGRPGSGIFNSTERLVQRVLNPLLKQSSIGASYVECKVIALRSMNRGSATAIDALCSRRWEPNTTALDRQKVYWELSNQTQGITSLGPYILDKNNFFLDGYSEYHPMEHLT
ncbi:mucin-16-like, partial [Vombatus ursinus]|uniref:mucin-16-like n=1 Tax=Vombatus ursinus TaxID=29139 RepID=UPI000FFD1E0C